MFLMEMNHHCIYLKCFVCSLLDETSGKLASVVQANRLVCFSQSRAGAGLAGSGKVQWLLRGGTCSPARAWRPSVKRVALWLPGSGRSLGRVQGCQPAQQEMLFTKNQKTELALKNKKQPPPSLSQKKEM